MESIPVGGCFMASGPGFDKVSQVRISVITATYNAATILRTLFESLRAQTFRDFEWVVADGASTDETVVLLQEFSRECTWVKYVSEPDFGFYDALNKGVQRAAAPCYVVAGADDQFAPDALQNFVHAIERECADVVLADVLIDGRRVGGFHPGRAWLSASNVFTGSHSVGMAFRTSLHARHGRYSPQFPLLADSLFLKILLRSGDVQFHYAGFVAGEFAKGGLTTVSKVRILAETWQIQLLTERHPVFQTIVFVVKLILRMPLVVREARARRLISFHK
jgi:glycosyltransferase involved in cell wall biosynthesis